MLFCRLFAPQTNKGKLEVRGRKGISFFAHWCQWSHNLTLSSGLRKRNANTGEKKRIGEHANLHHEEQRMADKLWMADNLWEMDGVAYALIQAGSPQLAFRKEELQENHVKDVGTEWNWEERSPHSCKIGPQLVWWSRVRLNTRTDIPWKTEAYALIQAGPQLALSGGLGPSCLTQEHFWYSSSSGEPPLVLCL